uniref:tRNA (guanine(46)-N(7))-methyltransferase n=1 Tax=Odontella aurita TaxID=265563 RepID=A0A6U6HFK9_9STRA|mmetsp:Transcript_47728/g.144315  ORF Transcript_47728/g.144315 Transcript_47728/m.144315 type:complete len:286 (+) Transcript_47728:145-1002(+)
MLSSCRRIKVVVAFVCSLLPTSRSFPTRYTIDDSVCAPLEEAELRKVVNRNCESLHKFLQKKPIATHTRAAFNQVSPLIDLSKPIVLDSGCGTARSTILLGDRFPDHTIVGVDRSFVRLNRNNLEGDDSFINPSEESQRPFQALSSNVLLVRAELTDFWRCCLDAEWNIEKHFILYPNPYPKKNRLKKRFYAHPSFPLILQLGGDITVRSNWMGYLTEFAHSVEYAHDFYRNTLDDRANNPALQYMTDALRGPVERTDKSIAWTNFEKKYDNSDEPTYELVLNRE